MLYSKLFTKTKKNAPSEETSKSVQLLIRGGFIQKEMAGVYAYLPLGKRVLEKIINIIREEMIEVGGQEVLLGSLQNPEVWKTTNRWADEIIDVWFKTRLKNDTEVGLATTHEEALTSLMTQHIQSYKDLPAYIFQFQTKFRNELRAKSGILRTREFIMKDLYSFNKTLEEQEEFYKDMQDAYLRIFQRIGLGEKTYMTFASGGAFSKYSHEFQTVCEAGEDTIYLDRNKNLAVNQEVYTPEVLEELGLRKEELEEVAAVEVGNIFKLGTKYSDPLGLHYTDENGERKPVVMGSYGIGPGRCMGTVIETHHDENGMIWPETIAPFKVHLVGLNLEDNTVRERAVEIYKDLINKNIEVLFDDRIDTSAGEKFSDADLIGIPHRLVVSQKTGNKIEYKHRAKEETKLVEITQILAEIK